MGEYSVVLFDSSSLALRAEKVLQATGISIKMIPTPRQISSDCGMSLRFNRDDEERVARALTKHEVPTNGIHDI